MVGKITFSKKIKEGPKVAQQTAHRLYSKDMKRWIANIPDKGTKFECKEEYKTLFNKEKFLTPVQKLKERAISFSQSYLLKKVLAYIAGMSPWALPLACIVVTAIAAIVVFTLSELVPFLLVSSIAIIGFSILAAAASTTAITYINKCKRRSSALDSISELIKGIEDFHQENKYYEQYQLFQLLQKMIDAEHFGMDNLQYQKALNSLNNMLELEPKLKEVILELVEQQDIETLTRKINNFIDSNTKSKARDILYELTYNDSICVILLKDKDNGETNFNRIVEVLRYYIHIERGNYRYTTILIRKINEVMSDIGSPRALDLILKPKNRQRASASLLKMVPSIFEDEDFSVENGNMQALKPREESL